MRKSHLCQSWSAAAAAPYEGTNFFIKIQSKSNPNPNPNHFKFEKIRSKSDPNPIQIQSNSQSIKLPYGKTHVAITSTHRFNCPATMAIETLEATSKYKKPKSVSITPTLPYKFFYIFLCQGTLSRYPSLLEETAGVQ
ncbi:hypothetical protein OUZ56_026666 [Daphnia magna]|uniref:Uncharacterized protein n=1 Tax=Daphnia magna TaxID=35525 RepID=A0ABQ9ZMG3_9CRUS|nr:hypothetical protein OUZ56_026666 [Daphnia magna]